MTEPVWLQTGYETSVAVSDFGIIGDGETINNARLSAMRDALRAADPLAHWTIIFRSGQTYLYDDPWWLAGLRSVTLDLNGAHLRYVRPGGSSTSLFGVPDPFLRQALDNNGLYYEGFPFATAYAGATELSIPGAAQNFSAGNIILIGSVDDIPSGYPPNFRLFEHNIVRSVSADSIAVNPIRYTYKSTHPVRPLGPFSVGNARAYKLTGRGPFSGYPDMLVNATIRNGKISGADSSHRFHLPVAGDFRAEGVDFDVVTYGAPARSMVWQDCTVSNSELEIDKLIDRCTFRGGHYYQINGTSGVDSLTIDGTTITHPPQLHAKSIALRDVTAGAVLIGSRVRKLKIDGGRYPFGKSQGGYGGFIIPSDWTGEKHQISAVNGASVSFVGGAIFEPGAVLMRADGALYGKVHDVVAGPVYIMRWSSNTAAIGDEFYVLPAARISGEESAWSPTGWPACIPDPYIGEVKLAGAAVQKYVVDKFMIPTKISSITARVTRAGGAGANFLLRTFGGAAIVMQIDMTTTGTRQITSSGATGSAGSDYLAGYPLLAGYLPRLRIDTNDFGPDPNQWPLFEVVIQTEPLLPL